MILLIPLYIVSKIIPIYRVDSLLYPVNDAVFARSAMCDVRYTYFEAYPNISFVMQYRTMCNIRSKYYVIVCEHSSSSSSSDIVH